MRTGKILKQQGSKLLILIFFLAIFDASAKGQSSETNKWSEYTQKKSVPAETGFGEETSADDVASELFSIMAEIAIEKARRDAADVLVGRIKNKLCAIEIKSDPPVKLQSRLTRTCRVLDSANYNNLDSLGKSLKDAFIEDVISNGKNVLIRELEKKFFGAKVQLKDLVRDFEKIKNELDNSKKEFDALITSMD
ncbi:MAG: hypothetical protein GY754_23740, partial [bacterium]|nr:hypothetical protein [bacterium]